MALFYAGWWPYAPHLQHPKIMILGFGFAFITGFLGTAWPRFLEARALQRSEVVLLVLTWLAAQGLYATHQLRAGDIAFGLHASSLLGVLLLRLFGQRDSDTLPPPGFQIAFLSVLLATGIAWLWAAMPWSLSPWMVSFTKLLAWQGILLLPLLGVGSYLFARFFVEPGERPQVAASNQRALGVWLAAAMVLLSFGLEASGWIRVGNLLRFFAIVTWAGVAVPALWKGKAPTSRAWALRMAVGSMTLSFLARGFWPGPGYAFEHILFLAGFGLAMLLVADRVSIGHGGDWEQVPAKSNPWRWMVWLALIAAATRASADFKASIVVSHHIYAALLWVAVLIVWTNVTARFWRRVS